jgi:PhnB protein
MAINAYINFNGNCREAVEFYAQVFGTEKPQIMTFGDTPPDPEFALPEEAKNLVMHTYLNICGSKVMFSDTFPGMPYILGNNISLAIVINDVDELNVLFNRLKVGGTVGMELQETFWSKCYGTLTDKYGTMWQLSHENDQM